MSGDLRASFIQLHILNAKSKNIQEIFLFFFIKENFFLLFGFKDKKIVPLDNSKNLLPQLANMFPSAYYEIADDKIDPSIPEQDSKSTYMHPIYFREMFLQRRYIEITPNFHLFYGKLNLKKIDMEWDCP